jgi:hypothetical protein
MVPATVGAGIELGGGGGGAVAGWRGCSKHPGMEMVYYCLWGVCSYHSDMRHIVPWRRGSRRVFGRNGKGSSASHVLNGRVGAYGSPGHARYC